MNKIVEWAVSLVLVAIPFGVIASLGFEGLQKFIRAINELPAVVKRAAFPFIAIGVTAVGSYAGVEITCSSTENCLETLDVGTIETIVRGLVAGAVGLIGHKAIKGGRK